MKLINASYEIINLEERDVILKRLELAGRTAYKSEDKITPDSATKFIEMIVKRGHLSVIEHASMSVKFIFDRGISHEMVRHRLASFTQESTRYCNYSKKNEDGGLNILDIKEHMTPEQYEIWLDTMFFLESQYKTLLNAGAPPQIARSVLPNSLKTEIVVTANLREWKEILRQRTSVAAHPQIREVMIPLSIEMNKILPEIFPKLD
jgi:thymidylate synthase (FAD)